MISFLFFFFSPAHAATFEDYLQSVEQKNPAIESSKLALQAAEAKLKSADLSFVPLLSFKGLLLSDKKQPSQLGASESLSDQYSVSLMKKMSTGSMISVTAFANGFENKGVSSPLFSQYAKYGQGGYALSFSQSLWKDSFGYASRLKAQRDRLSYLIEKNIAEMNYQQKLIEAEVIFWDYQMTLKEVETRKSSLQRASRIYLWMKQRVQDGIADRVDALSAEALLETRKMQLQSAQDQLRHVQEKLKDQLALKNEDTLLSYAAQIDRKRGLFKSSNSQKPLRRDAVLSLLESQLKAKIAEETEDSLRADLNLAATYSTNSYAANGTASDALKDANKTETPTTTVTLNWNYVFDQEAKSSAFEAAKLSAQSAKILAQSKQKESETTWQEILRRYKELDQQIQSLTRISQLQSDRAASQAGRLSRGRTVTSEVINSEQDAADTELQLIKMQVEQRKIEAQVRAYTGDIE